ncbi:MAG: hypothetical protein JW910_12110 [Anaerolineae bacterium]|nr:hypothetical protein [Anaerolineae bacterium]
MTHRNKYLLAFLTLGMVLLAALWLAPTMPATAQTDSYLMCINVPESIALGNTEQLTVGVYRAGSEPADHTCQAINALPDEAVGAGLRGVELGNFNIDPADTRLPGCAVLDGMGDCNWVFQATGEAGSSHNLVEYLYVPDETRTAGIRTLAIMSQRITITDSLTFLEQLGQFFDSTVGRVSALAGAVVAVLGAYAAWRNLRKGEAKQ